MNLRRTKGEKEPWAPIGAAQHRYAAKCGGLLAAL
jgi:hypothetical protein